jgi:hypothetical protein
VTGAVTEVAVGRVMEQRLGMVAEPYSEGKGGRYMKTGEQLLAAGAAAAVAGHWRPALGRVGGALMLVGSAMTRWGVFEAGMASADDPKYTVQPQRERLEARAAEQTPRST